MTNFPGALDAFVNPQPTDLMDSGTVPHDVQHSNLNDAVAALQAKVGITGSAVETTLDYLVNQILEGLPKSGTLIIPNNSAQVVATGLALGFTPVTVILTVESPNGGSNIFAGLAGAPTSDGFTANLSGAVDATGTFKLHYIAIP